MTEAKIVSSLVSPEDDIRLVKRRGQIVLVEVTDTFHTGVGEPDIERWTPSEPIATLVDILCARSHRLGYAAGQDALKN